MAELAFLLAGILAFGLALLPLTKLGLWGAVLILVISLALNLVRLSADWGVVTFLAGLFVASGLGLILQGLRRVFPRRRLVTLVGAAASAALTVSLQYSLLMQA